MASATADIERLASSITCHAWNGDRTKVAICPNNNEVQIYNKTAAGFQLECTLAEHDQVVTSIDWAPNSNRIVSCSQDRNAYVWAYANEIWKPTLVILRINRAATHARWSPDENKFAVASGAKVVSICYFEQDNDWWISKHIKKHKSTVLKVDWHPNNFLLATGSSDFKARVFSALIKGVDARPSDSPFGTKLPFGEPLLELDSLGWVHAVKWSPSGTFLAFTGHDSSITIANVSSLPPQVQKIKLAGLPVRDLLFLSDHSLVGVGEDNNPLFFSATDAGEWSFVTYLDQKSGAATEAASKSARDMFAGKVEAKLDTKHQNCITSIFPFAKTGNIITDFSTSGLDGAVVVWHVKTIETQLRSFRLR